MVVTRYLTIGMVWLMVLLGAVAQAQAQEMPKIAEFYFDEDVAAKPIQALPPGQDGLLDQLMKLRERGRKGVEATVQLAGIAYADGRTELGAKLYEEALAAVSENSTHARGILWNRGWDQYRAGDTEAALADWTKVIQGGRGNPGWIPPTLALALWKLDRRDEAVAWYAAAVRTEPEQWNDAARLSQSLPEWRDEDRAVLAEVLQAWTANPPAWP